MDGASTQAVRKSSKCVEEVLAKPLFFLVHEGATRFLVHRRPRRFRKAAGSAASADAVDTATTNIVGR
jgi:hypothetical protein